MFRPPPSPHELVHESLFNCVYAVVASFSSSLSLLRTFFFFLRWLFVQVCHEFCLCVCYVLFYFASLSSSLFSFRSVIVTGICEWMIPDQERKESVCVCVCVKKMKKKKKNHKDPPTTTWANTLNKNSARSSALNMLYSASFLSNNVFPPPSAQHNEKKNITIKKIYQNKKKTNNNLQSEKKMW